MWFSSTGFRGWPAMPNDPEERDRGFTLIEVLVALVVTSLLLVIVMNAALSAKARTKASQEQREAVLLAGALVESRALSPFDPGRANGKAGALSWELAEHPVTRDPRGFFVLSRIEAKVSNSEGRTVYQLSTRKLKTLPVS